MQLSRKTAPMLGLATLAALGLAAIQPAQAQVGTYGDVQVVTNGTNTYWQITSDPAGTGYGGLYIDASTLTPATVTNLSADYVFTSGTNGGGAPRFSLADATPNQSETYDYWGTPQSGGTFTDPNAGATGFNSTGNLADGASTDQRVQINGFGGDSSGATYITYSDFVARDGGTPLSYITLDLDGGFTGTQVLDVSSFTVNGTTYTPTLPTPEPSSVAAFAFTGLGALGLMLRARKRKASAV